MTYDIFTGRDDSIGKGELSSEILSLIEDLRDCYDINGKGNEEKIKKVIDEHYTNEVERKRIWEVYQGTSLVDNQKREIMKKSGTKYDELWFKRDIIDVVSEYEGQVSFGRIRIQDW